MEGRKKVKIKHFYFNFKIMLHFLTRIRNFKKQLFLTICRKGYKNYCLYFHINYQEHVELKIQDAA